MACFRVNVTLTVPAVSEILLVATKTLSHQFQILNLHMLVIGHDPSGIFLWRMCYKCLSLLLCQNDLESLAVPLDIIFCTSDSVTVCYL